MTSIVEIEGIGEKYAEKLQNAGYKTVESYLEAVKTTSARKTMSEKTGIDSDLILKWANRADLHRIKGVGSEYADLLEAAGVDTVPELANRNADNLHAKLEEINSKKELVRVIPTLAKVEDWISQAKELPRALEY